MTSPIRVELRIGGNRYDVSRFPSDKIKEIMDHVNAVQAIVTKQSETDNPEQDDPEG